MNSDLYDVVNALHSVYCKCICICDSCAVNAIDPQMAISLS